MVFPGGWWMIWKCVVLMVVTGVLAGCSEAREGAGSAAIKPVAAHDSSSPLKFTAPAEWTAETPSSAMRKAQYSLARVEGDPEDAKMVVFFFEGQGGSVQANIDRWIGQFTKADGSPATDVARVSKNESHGIPLTIVDVSGTYKESMGPMNAGTPKSTFRMLAAVAETGSGPWFFKLTGPAKTVAKWEPSFHTFLGTIQ
jgi:hypothetical protein